MILAEYYQLLKDYVSFKTVQGTKEFFSESQKLVAWMKDVLLKSGFEVDVIEEKEKAPILWARYVENKNLPMGLIYSYYDLNFQTIPAVWKNDPFSLYLGKEAVYGRGVGEAKGQFLIYLATFLDLIKEKKMGYNITLLLDGNQHAVGNDINTWIEKNRIDLKSDFCFFSSLERFSFHPYLEVGQRGGIDLEVSLSAPEVTLDSNLLGGIAPNPALELSRLLTKFYDIKQQISIPYFYYNIQQVPTEISVANRKNAPKGDDFRQRGGLLAINQQRDFDLLTQSTFLPALEVTSFQTFPQTTEDVNIIPMSAKASLNFKIVNHQVYDKVIASLQQWFSMNLPKYFKAEILIKEAYNPTKNEMTGPYLIKAKSLLEGVYSQPLLYKQNQMGLKVADTLQKHVTSTVISVPFASLGSNIGYPNENLTEEEIKKAFDFCFSFFSK